MASIARHLLVIAVIVASCERSSGSSHAPAASPDGPASAREPTGRAGPVAVTDLVEIRGGTWRGEPIAAFAIDRFEVTTAQYVACVAAGACASRTSEQGFEEVVEGEVGGEQRGVESKSTECNASRGDRADHPINCVDVHDAETYCAWVGKRLPTTQQWRWTATGGAEDRAYPWGAEPPDATRLNACGGECEFGKLYRDDDGFPTTAPVGGRPRGASVDGVHDLAGNVWEWTSSAGLFIEVLGGAWTTGELDQLGTRGIRQRAGVRSIDLGFRCVRTSAG